MLKTVLFQAIQFSITTPFKCLRAILNESWRQHPTATNYTATFLPLRKLYKLDEPDMQNTAGEVGTRS